MSLPHVSVAMATPRSDFVDVMAGWLSRADCRPKRATEAKFNTTVVSVSSYCLKHQQGFRSNEATLSLCTSGEGRNNNNYTHLFPTSRAMEQRDVWFLSSGCQKCQQHTLVVTSGGGRREEDRMLIRKRRGDVRLAHTHAPTGRRVNGCLAAQACPDTSSHNVGPKEKKHSHMSVHRWIQWPQSDLWGCAGWEAAVTELL